MKPKEREQGRRAGSASRAGSGQDGRPGRRAGSASRAGSGQDGRPGRRGFLQAAATAVVGTFALARCTKEDPYAVNKPPVPLAGPWREGEEKWVATACSQCPAGCGIRVRVVEGRAVKIEGNPACPINRGGIGPKGQSGLQLLYHPDRIRTPLKREGPRGSGGFKPVKWEDAIKEIAQELRTIRAHGESRGLVVLDGEPRGMMPELWERFLEAYGSPNHIDHRSTTDGGKVLAMTYMHGEPELPAYDWEGTRYVLGFGASLFESWCQTIHMTRASSYLRRGIPGQRVKFVQVSPRFSTTAAKADEWVPIQPATYGALALGLAHVLVRERLYDTAFVRDHAFGFEDWKDPQGRSHRGFRNLVLKDYPPEKAADITGVSVDTIERLAREMAGHRPAIALADGGAAAATNGLGTAMAIHALNALLGNLEKQGGMLVQKRAPLAPWPAIQSDSIARSGRSAPRVDGVGGPRCPLGRGFVQGLPEAIFSGKPYPVQALFLYRSNPFFSKPGGKAWTEAVSRVPLVVSFSPLPDESTQWADFVLPDHTYLERWDVVEPAPSIGYPILTLRQPVVPPLHDTAATGDVVLRLAQAVGGPAADALPWENYRAALTERLNGLVGGGNAVASDLDELEAMGQREGGWWNPGYDFEEWRTAFRTPSGKFEFYSQAMSEKLRSLFPSQPSLDKHLQGSGVATRGDDLCLPHWEPPRFAGDIAQYPFIIVAYRGIEYAEGGARHLPWLRELPSLGRFGWKERVELHPEDASRLGIREGDSVWVETPAGRRKLVAIVYPGIRPGTLGLPLGSGPWPPRADGTVSPGGYGLLANLSDPLAGIFALQGTRAAVKKEA